MDALNATRAAIEEGIVPGKVYNLPEGGTNSWAIP